MEVKAKVVEIGFKVHQKVCMYNQFEGGKNPMQGDQGKNYFNCFLKDDEDNVGQCLEESGAKSGRYEEALRKCE